MRKTKAALKELKQIEDFVGGFKRIKGREPEIIYITKKQRDTLGLEQGDKLLGKDWKVV